jgi:hypothetical protein
MGREPQSTAVDQDYRAPESTVPVFQLPARNTNGDSNQLWRLKRLDRLQSIEFPVANLVTHKALLKSHDMP